MTEVYKSVSKLAILRDSIQPLFRHYQKGQITPAPLVLLLDECLRQAREVSSSANLQTTNTLSQTREQYTTGALLYHREKQNRITNVYI